MAGLPSTHAAIAISGFIGRSRCGSIALWNLDAYRRQRSEGRNRAVHIEVTLMAVEQQEKAAARGSGRSARRGTASRCSVCWVRGAAASPDVSLGSQSCVRGRARWRGHSYIPRNCAIPRTA